MKYLSVYDNDRDIVEAIATIHNKGEGFELDPTYSKGVFYRKYGISEPIYKSDIDPVVDGVDKDDSRTLVLRKDSSIKSIIFDPPFLFRDRVAENRDLMCGRFSYFRTYADLKDMYSKSLFTFYRVLKDRGILLFKCQDMTDGSGSRPMYATHCFVINEAERVGFKLRDIGIRVNRGKIIKNAKQQGCLRKIHSYWLVFQKYKVK